MISSLCCINLSNYNWNLLINNLNLKIENINIFSLDKAKIETKASYASLKFSKINFKVTRLLIIDNTPTFLKSKNVTDLNKTMKFDPK